MLNWIFKNRFAGWKDEVRSAAADLARERRNVGLGNNPVPDYSRVAPNPLLRNQARYLVANNAVAARAAQAFVDNVIGPGITLLPKIGDAALKSLLLKRWNRWTEASDADGMLNWYGQQALAARSMFVDGEVFVRTLADSDGMLRLQLLPAEFIDTTITRDNVIAGIEFEGARRSAYYIYEWHPAAAGPAAAEHPHPVVRGAAHLPAQDARPASRRDGIDGDPRAAERPGPVRPRDARQAEDRCVAHRLHHDTKRKPAQRKQGRGRRMDRQPRAGHHPTSFSRRVHGVFRPSRNGGLLGLRQDAASAYRQRSWVALRRRHRRPLRHELQFGARGTYRAPQEHRRPAMAVHPHALPPCVSALARTREILRGALPPVDGGVQEYLDNISWAPPAMQMTDPQREVDAMVRAIRAGLISWEMAVASLGYDLAGRADRRRQRGGRRRRHRFGL